MQQVPKQPAQRSYSRQQLIEALQQLVADQGEDVTLDQFVRATGISITPICRLFGSWSALRQAVGLSGRGQKRSPAICTHEQLCGQLMQAVGQFGEEITLDQFLFSAGISATPIYRLFGSWPALQEAVGLRPRRNRLRVRRHSPQQMLEQVDQLMLEPDPPLTLKELIARSGLSRREVEAEFGSWEQLCEMLFIECRGGRLQSLSDEDLQQLVQWSVRTYQTLTAQGEPDS